MFRLAHLRTPDHDSRAVLLDDQGGWHDLAGVADDDTLADPMAAVARHDELHELAELAGHRPPDGVVADGGLGPCVPRPSKVFGIGLNYASHAAESNLVVSDSPATFTKFPNCLAGPQDDVVLGGDTVDWEVEVVAVIGLRGRSIAETDAWSHIAGLTLGQDISDRTVQLASTPPQFSLGKSFDTYGPIGPAVVSLDAFEDPDDVALWCDVNGERMQASRTSDLIVGVPALVAYLSSICTLEPGDLIFTGTTGRTQPVKAGDVIEIEIDGIGVLRNPVT